MQELLGWEEVGCILGTKGLGLAGVETVVPGGRARGEQRHKAM